MVKTIPFGDGELILTPDLPYRLKVDPRWSWNGVSVLEYRPGWRTVRVSGRSYRLPFPYMLFVVFAVKSDIADKPYEFNCLHVAYRNEPLTSVEDMVYTGFLPNQGGGSRLCLGRVRRYYKTLDDMARHIIGCFWASRFAAHEEFMFHEWHRSGKPNGFPTSLRTLIHADFYQGELPEITRGS